MTLPTGKSGEHGLRPRVATKPGTGGDPTSTEHGKPQAAKAEGGCPATPRRSGKAGDGREGVIRLPQIMRIQD